MISNMKALADAANWFLNERVPVAEVISKYIELGGERNFFEEAIDIANIVWPDTIKVHYVRQLNWYTTVEVETTGWIIFNQDALRSYEDAV